MTERAIVAESRQRLWTLVASPVLWALHFMASYVTAALWCGMIAGRDGTLDVARMLILLFTVVALAGIAVVGWLGYRAHSVGDAEVPHDDDTPEDRHRFLGFATLLLSGLSGVAVIYSAVSIVFISTCQ